MELTTSSVNEIPVLTISGRFDAYEAPEVAKWIEQSVADGKVKIVLNLSATTFIDSTALATLIKCMKRAREHQGDVLICELQQAVRIIFELTRLDRAFQIFSSQEEAVAAFN